MNIQYYDSEEINLKLFPWSFFSDYAILREIWWKTLNILSFVVAAINAGIGRMFTEFLWCCNILPSDKLFVWYQSCMCLEERGGINKRKVVRTFIPSGILTHFTQLHKIASNQVTAAELRSDFKYMSEVGADRFPGTKFSAGVNIHVAFRLSLLHKYFNKQRLTSSSDIKLRLGL